MWNTRAWGAERETSGMLGMESLYVPINILPPARALVNLIVSLSVQFYNVYNFLCRFAFLCCFYDSVSQPRWMWSVWGEAKVYTRPRKVQLKANKSSAALSGKAKLARLPLARWDEEWWRRKGEKQMSCNMGVIKARKLSAFAST